MFTPFSSAAPHQLVGAPGHPHRDRVEERVVHELDPSASKARGECGRAARAPGRRCASARRDRGTRRTSTRRPRAAPARCRCCSSPSHGGCAARGSAARAAARRAAASSRHTDEATRSERGVRRLRGDERRRAGPPNPSGTPNRCADPTTMSAPCSPGGVTRQQARRSVGDHDERAARRARRRRARAGRGRARWSTRVLQQHAEGSVTVADERVRVADLDLDAERLGPRSAPPRSSAGGSRRRRRTRSPTPSARAGGPSPSPRPPPSPRRAATRSRAPSPVRSVTIVWKFSERLEPALRDLGLVRRVRGVPGRVLEHVALDHRGRDRAVSSPSPMSDVNDLVLRPRARAAPPSASASPSAAGRSSGSCDRIAAGTAAAVRSSSVVEAERGEHLGLLGGDRDRCDARANGVGRAQSVASSAASRLVADVSGCAPPLSRNLRDSPEPGLSPSVRHSPLPSGRGDLLSRVASPARSVEPERFRGGCSFGAFLRRTLPHGFDGSGDSTGGGLDGAIPQPA